MESSIKQILSDNRADGVIQTHVSMIEPKGSFHFQHNIFPTFWENYCDAIYSDENYIFGIAEKSQSCIPVMVDADIKIKKDENMKIFEGEHIYSDNHVKRVIKIYQDILKMVVDNCDDSLLTCVLLEKPIYYIDGNDVNYAKNGFHLHFPKIFLKKEDQIVHIFERVKDTIKEEQVFSDIGIEKSENVIDKAPCVNPWLLYGSRKNEMMSPYKVTKIFDHNLKEISPIKAFKKYDIFDENQNKIKITKKIEYYYPRIFSIIPYNRKIAYVKSNLTIPIREKMRKKQNEKDTTKNKHNYSNQSIDDILKIASRMINMLNPERADDRNDWMVIGWILFNIGEGNDTALTLWLEFSQLSDKYDESKCVYEWERMIKKDYTIGTLRFLAEKDNPESYKKFKDEQSKKFINDSLNGSHTDLAKLLHSENSNDFVCASIKNSLWYQYKNHKWTEIEDGTYLRNIISSDIEPKYKKMKKEIYDQLSEEEDKSMKSMYNERLKRIEKITSRLGDTSFKNSVMVECKHIFFDDRFKEKLDQNPNIIGFTNGVYDFNLNEFRDGRPEDFISKTLPIDYKEFSETDEEVQSVILFLKQIFPDNQIRKYFCDTYSDLFIGGNNQKKIYMWTGDGDNGKSITQKFIEMMLGQLSIKFNTQYFTGKKISSGSANPELSRAAPPVRLATMEEPDADEQLNIGELKKLSGGDSFWARDLFEKGKNTREVFPMFMLTFICNKLPKLKHADKATWSRIRVIPFESTFVDGKDCPSTHEEQIKQKRFLMDKNFTSKIPALVPAFAWYLIQWRQRVKGVIEEPEKVMDATELYRKRNDLYRQYMSEHITEDVCKYISMSELYSNFKEWFKEGFPNMTLPIKNEVKEYFEKIWGEPEKGGRWKGYRFRTIEEEIERGDAVVMDASDFLEEPEFMGPPM